MDSVENILFGQLAIHGYFIFVGAHVVELLVAQLTLTVRPNELKRLPWTLFKLMLAILRLDCQTTRKHPLIFQSVIKIKILVSQALCQTRNRLWTFRYCQVLLGCPGVLTLPFTSCRVATTLRKAWNALHLQQMRMDACIESVLLRWVYDISLSWLEWLDMGLESILNLLTRIST